MLPNLSFLTLNSQAEDVSAKRKLSNADNSVHNRRKQRQITEEDEKDEEDEKISELFQEIKRLTTFESTDVVFLNRSSLVERVEKLCNDDKFKTICEQDDVWNDLNNKLGWYGPGKYENWEAFKQKVETTRNPVNGYKVKYLESVFFESLPKSQQQAAREQMEGNIKKIPQNARTHFYYVLEEINKLWMKGFEATIYNIFKIKMADKMIGDFENHFGQNYLTTFIPGWVEIAVRLKPNQFEKIRADIRQKFVFISEQAVSFAQFDLLVKLPNAFEKESRMLKVLQNPTFPLPKEILEKYQNNKNLAEQAILSKPDAFRLFGDNVRNNFELAKIAVAGNGHMIQYVGQQLRADEQSFRKVAFEAVVTNASAIEHLGNDYKNDKDFLRETLKENEYVARHIGPGLLNDVQTLTTLLVEEVLPVNVYVFRELPEQYRSNMDVANAAVVKNWTMLEFVGDGIKNSQPDGSGDNDYILLIKRALEISPFVLRLVDKNIDDYENIIERLKEHRVESLGWRPWPSYYFKNESEMTKEELKKYRESW